MNNQVLFFVDTYGTFSWGYLGVEFLGARLGTQISKVVVQFYTPTRNVEFILLYISFLVKFLFKSFANWLCFSN